MILLANANDKSKVENVQSTSFHSLGVLERSDLQEWIRRNPEVLGEELLIVSMEFSQFAESRDRLDLLAIDKNGRLVVCEFKRDAYAGYADLQSIRYAAMVSTMTLKQLATYYDGYRKKYNELANTDGQTSEEIILDFIENDDFTEIDENPRIILCSENFSQEVTTTVLWLNANKLDISCVRLTPHKVHESIILVPTKIIPIAEATEYMILLKEKQEEVRETTKRSRRPATMNVLLDHQIIKEGDTIILDSYLPDYVPQDPANPIYQAVVTGDRNKGRSIKWKVDGESYSMSRLTKKIFGSVHPDKVEPSAVHGPLHWRTENGENLWDKSDEILNKP